MKIWATNPCENNLYQAILHNKKINVDIGGDDSQSDIPIPVIINVYDKEINTCLSSYSHAMSIMDVLKYITSYPRYNKLYDFEVIRLDKLNNNNNNNNKDDKIHKDKSIQLLNEALQEYQHMSNIFNEAFECYGNEKMKIMANNASNVVNILQTQINTYKNN